MTDLICFSHLRWDFVWQRPQHLLSRMASDYRILFVEEPIASAQIAEPYLDHKTYTYGASQVTVVRLMVPLSPERWIGHGDPLTQHLYSDLLCSYMATQQYYNPIMWLYTPMAYDFVQTIPHSLLVVDVMDQLSAFKGAPIELVNREIEALRNADVVFTGGVSLYRDKLPYNAHTYLFPSGVDADHFGKATISNRLPVPADMAQLTGVILGYYGVIDERMDMSLLSYLAEQHPEWHIVLVGPVVKIDPATIPQAPNIHVLGMRSYEELPSYLAQFDVALIPFALNDSTRFVSPTKTLEYMAAHKPIVSTPIRDVMELYGTVVHIGYDPQSFAEQIQNALADSPVERRFQEDELLTMYAWDQIVVRMKRIMVSRLPTQIRRSRANALNHVASLNIDSSAISAAVGGDR